MKLIENACGLVRAGHCAIRTDGATIIETSEERGKKLARITDRIGRIGFCDRIVSPSEFVRATGCTVSIAGKVYKPDRVKTKIKKPVLDLL